MGGLAEITGAVYDITEKLANDRSRLVFTEAGPKTQVSRGTRMKGWHLE
ncbi:MAG: hypothetical protein R2727_05145 [Bacteroidales bacterium]